MSEAPVDRAGARLKTCLVRQIDRRQFGEVEFLKELAIFARETTKVATSERMVLAFVLESVLQRWAIDIESRDSLLSERATLRQRFENPISDAIIYLSEGNGDFLVITETLINLASAAFEP